MPATIDDSKYEEKKSYKGRVQKKIKNVNFFLTGVAPPPPSKCKLFDKIKKKCWCLNTSSVALRTHQNTLLC